MATAKDHIPCKSLSSYYNHYVRHVRSFHHHIRMYNMLDWQTVVRLWVPYYTYRNCQLSIVITETFYPLTSYPICEYFLATKWCACSFWTCYLIADIPLFNTCEFISTTLANGLVAANIQPNFLYGEFLWTFRRTKLISDCHQVAHIQFLRSRAYINYTGVLIVYVIHSLKPFLWAKLGSPHRWTSQGNHHSRER